MLEKRFSSLNVSNFHTISLSFIITLLYGLNIFIFQYLYKINANHPLASSLKSNKEKHEGKKRVPQQDSNRQRQAANF